MGGIGGWDVSEERIEDPELGVLVNKSGDWDGRATLPLPVAIRECDMTIEWEGDTPSEAQREAARYALRMTREAQGRLAETLHADYLMTLDAVGPDDLPEMDTPADVWAHVQPIQLNIPNHEDLRRRYFVLQFEVAWETEGGAEVLFRDGLPVELDIIGSTGQPSQYDDDDGDADADGE